MKLGAVVFVVVFFVVAGVTTAACPQPPVETSVDLDAYLGKWYQIATSTAFADVFEHDVICDTAEYSPGPSGTVVVNNTGIGEAGTPKAGKVTTAIGKAKVVSPGKLEVSFFGNVYAPYWITQLYGNATTGYDAAVVFSCQEVLGITNENMWVLSRTNVLPAGLTLDGVLKVSASQGIDVAKIKVVATTQNCGN